MPGIITYKITGLDKLYTKATMMYLMSGPMRNFLERGSKLIQNDAKTNVNVYTSETKESIDVDIDGTGVPMWARIGSEKESAASLELGSKPHFPNIDNITPWALDHGWDPWSLGAAIAEHGTDPHPYLLPAAEDNIPSLVALVGVMAVEIEARAGIG